MSNNPPVLSHLPERFQFSQSSLQDFVDCARRFELRYLQNLRWPSVVAEPLDAYEQQTLLGERFHRLIHQALMGVPTGALERMIADAPDPLREWWGRYQQSGAPLTPRRYYPEVTLFTVVAGYRLAAKYDVFGFDDSDQVVIIDWKTAQRPPDRQRLAARLQAQVYPLVAVEAGAQLNGGRVIAPEQVRMVFWFAQADQPAEVFSYSAEQYQRDRERITDLIHDLRARRSFPMTDDERHCRFCRYRSLCARGVAAGRMDDDLTPEADTPDQGDLNDLLGGFDQIAEIEF